jgi:hypothetical protein
MPYIITGIIPGFNFLSASVSSVVVRGSWFVGIRPWHFTRIKKQFAGLRFWPGGLGF